MSASPVTTPATDVLSQGPLSSPTLFVQEYQYNSSSAKAFWPVRTAEGDTILILIDNREWDLSQVTADSQLAQMALREMCYSSRSDLTFAVVRSRRKQATMPGGESVFALVNWFADPQRNAWFYSDPAQLARLLGFSRKSLQSAGHPADLTSRKKRTRTSESPLTLPVDPPGLSPDQTSARPSKTE
jgi:hypothetical protein